VINGKQHAFRDFTEIFAQKLKEGIPGVSGQVDRVLQSAGFDDQPSSSANGTDSLSRSGDGVTDREANR
jgi:hypothetical protein